MARVQVEVRTDDGTCPASVFRPGGGSGPWPGVLVYMDGAGIRPALSSTDRTKGASDTKSFLDFFDAEGDLAGQKLGVVGYCLGGGMALTASALYPERFVAAASFHGAALATHAADSPHKLAGRIRAKVLVAGADKDAGFPAEQAALLASALKDAGVDHRVEIWAGAAHGWTMTDFPVHNEGAAERHFQELVALFKETLPAAR